MKKGILLFSTLFIFIGTSFSANISWKFGVSGDWSVNTNWVGDVLPGLNDYAIINAGAAAVVTVSTTVTVQGVRVITSTLNVTGSGILNCTEGTTFPGIWHTSGPITNDGTINIAMVTNQSGIQLQGAFVNNGTINISNVSNQGINALSGSFSNTGNVNIDNTLTANGTGIALAINFTNSGTISIGASTALGGHGISVGSGTILANTGTINIDNTAATRDGISNSGTINNTAGAINIGENNLVNGRGINNSGTIVNSADITLNQVDGDGILANAGSSFNNTGNLKINGGGTSSMFSFTSGSSGALTNTGNLMATQDIVGGNFTNSGTLSPGQSPGLLNIRNIYNSGAGAKYLAEVGGTTAETEYDQLHFYNAGAANFDISTTVLEVQLIDGFSPDIGDEFDIMTSAFGYTGNFSAPILPALPADREWMLDYASDPTKLTLKAVAILPVQFTYFNIQKQKDNALLSWQTATELNNKGFEILKSSNTKEWEVIGFVTGEQTSYDAINYSFIDKHPKDGMNYYRLKQIDYDGRFDYSSIVKIDFSKKSTVNIFPNPSNGKFSIFYDNVDQQQFIQVFSAAGAKIMDTVVVGNSLDLSSLSPGIYFLQIEDDWKKISIK